MQVVLDDGESPPTASSLAMLASVMLGIPVEHIEVAKRTGSGKWLVLEGDEAHEEGTEGGRVVSTEECNPPLASGPDKKLDNVSADKRKRGKAANCDDKDTPSAPLRPPCHSIERHERDHVCNGTCNGWPLRAISCALTPKTAARPRAVLQPPACLSDGDMIGVRDKRYGADHGFATAYDLAIASSKCAAATNALG